jgi:hypothetical protein
MWILGVWMLIDEDILLLLDENRLAERDFMFEIQLLED